ncbi:MAG: dihydrofolate reductase, partial [Pseudomonadota bacterium]
MLFEVPARVAIIVGAAENGVIGAHGAIPWHLSSDLKYFKARTVGQSVVMGRLTYLSIGRPLPGRRTIVVTQSTIEGVETVKSLRDALAVAGRPVFLAGGSRIYEAGLEVADTIFLTRVHASPAGDTRFPAIDAEAFECVWRQAGEQGPRDDHPFTFE